MGNYPPRWSHCLLFLLALGNILEGSLSWSVAPPLTTTPYRSSFSLFKASSSITINRLFPSSLHGGASSLPPSCRSHTRGHNRDPLHIWKKSYSPTTTTTTSGFTLQQRRKNVSCAASIARDDEDGASSSGNDGPHQQHRKSIETIFNAFLLVTTFGYAFYTIFNIDHGMTRGWSQSEIAMRIPLDNWNNYENSLSEHPVETKTAINVIIYLLGDWLSQTLFQEKNVLDFDATRTLRNGFIGLCFGPLVHLYYEWSDTILPPIDWTNKLEKILMDQTLYLGIKCSVYITAVGVLAGDSFQDSTKNAKDRIFPVMVTAWKFWPLVHCVTYSLIPAKHRILWVNCVDLIWNAILASLSRSSTSTTGDVAAVDQHGAKTVEVVKEKTQANVLIVETDVEDSVLAAIPMLSPPAQETLFFASFAVAKEKDENDSHNNNNNNNNTDNSVNDVFGHENNNDMEKSTNATEATLR